MILKSDCSTFKFQIFSCSRETRGSRASPNIRHDEKFARLLAERTRQQREQRGRRWEQREHISGRRQRIRPGRRLHRRLAQYLRRSVGPGAAAVRVRAVEPGGLGVAEHHLPAHRDTVSPRTCIHSRCSRLSSRRRDVRGENALSHRVLNGLNSAGGRPRPLANRSHGTACRLGVINGTIHVSRGSSGIEYDDCDDYDGNERQRERE